MGVVHRVAVVFAYDRLPLKGGHHRRRSVCLNLLA